MLCGIDRRAPFGLGWLGYHARQLRPLLFAAIISFLAILVASGFAFSANAAPLEDVPQTLVQPDGEELHVFATGDEFYHWLHDSNGYVIVQDPSTGFYVYAVEQNGDIVPSQYVVGKVDPAQAGLTPNIRVSPEKYQQRRAALRPFAESLTPVPSVNTGTLNNLVVFIRFSGETEFEEDLSAYDDMLNDDTAGANSLRNYYREVSYDQLTVSSTLYPTTTGTTVVSYLDSHARGYYRPYNATSNTDGYDSSNMAGRELDLLRSALNSVKAQVPAGLNLDNNNDGKVDNVAFIVRGTSDGWSDLLWPHMWWLPGSNTVTINNKQVSAYNLELQAQLNGGRGVGILAHEMFHTLGAPDLYHYSYDGLHPAWKWDLMEWDLNPPEHMGAYMKQRYGGWIASIPAITASGTYTLNPLTSSTNNAYKIASPNSSAEYFVVEYRKKAGAFESSLPGEGLLVYRIDTARDGQGNRDGPPEEVYVYRPDGRMNADGRRDDAAFSSQSGRTSFNDDTNPRPFLSDGSAGGLRISGVGAIGDTISFRVDFGAIVTDTASVSVLEDGTGTFGVKLSEQPSGDTLVSVSRQSGDTGITVQSGASLTFTAANWNTYQTVTLADVRDDDFRDDSAIIRVDGPGMSHLDVTATEQDIYGVGMSWPGVSVPFYDGFESGALSGAWKKNPGYGVGVGDARVRVTGDYSPHIGSNHVMMDSAYGDSFGELILSVDLEGKKDVTLSFWHKEDWHEFSGYSDPRPVIPESFAEHYNGRGLAVSNDGGTWYRVDPLDSGKNTYTFHSINLDTITDLVKLPYTSHFLIKFQWVGFETAYSTRAAWFDDISVSVGRTLSLITPTGTGERGLAGWPRTITWTSSGNIGADVKIELYKGNSLDSTIAYSTPNDGNFSWPIPVTQQHDFDYRVKISAIDDPDVYDISNNDFEIYGAELTLTSPNGGERWQQYSTHNITWTSVNYTGPVKIDLYKGGALERTLNASATNDGSEIWNIPSTQPAGDDYKVRITAVDVPSVSDWGDDNFSVYAPGLVLRSPNGGEHLMRGSTYAVTWDKVGNPGATVKLELLKGGVLSNTIYTWTANNGSVPWSVLSGQQPGTDYRIRITDLSFPDATDQSDADFEIVPGSIKITAPAVGARFQQGSYVDIYWGDTGDPGSTVKVEVFKGGELNTLVITDWSEHVGWARWGIPIGQAPGTDYAIKVTSLAYPGVSDMSKSFEVYAGSVQVTAPNGGEAWQHGSTHDITWTSTYPATAAVKLEMYKSGALDSTIVASTENDGSYTWPIPSGQAAGTTYRVKLSFVTALGVSDTSDNDFKVEAVGIAVTAPNGGERWQRGIAHEITWTSSGNPSPDIRIELYKAGVLDSTIAASTPDDGSYSWPIPAGQALGMVYRVKVSSASSPTLNDSSDADFVIGDVTPTLTTITPNSGTNNMPPGAFELAGTGFVSGATVKLAKTGQSDIVASSVSVVSGATITCVLDLNGKAAGLWDVVVANADGQSATLPSGFTVNNPPPMVFWITPNRATTEAGILQITDLMGQGFLPGATVKLSRFPQPDIVATNVVVVSPTKMTCTLDLTGAQAGVWDVVVNNPWDPLGNRMPMFFIDYPAPVVTAITPNSGSNDGAVSITDLAGAKFRAGVEVKLSRASHADIVATDVVVVSATKITCAFDLSGKEVGLWDVVVTNSDFQSVTLTGGFTVRYPPPSVSSITPGTGTNDGKVKITDLWGSRFQPGAVVKLRNSGQPDIVATGVTVVAASKITCTFDLNNAVTGLWDVVVTNTDGQSGTLAGGFGMSQTPFTKRWAAPVSGEWGDASKWTPSGVPTASHIVGILVDGDYTVALHSNQSANRLTVGNPANDSVQRLAILGDPWAGNATLTVGNGMTNAGVINLTEYDFRGMTSTLVVSSGVLTNKGTIEVNNTDRRYIRANLDNQGTMNLNVGLTLDKTGAIYTNTGAINIASGATMTVTGATAFSQNGGALSLAGAYTQPSGTFSFNGGAITGSGAFTLTSGVFNMSAAGAIQPNIDLVASTLNITAGGTGPAAFNTWGGSSIAGNVAAGQTVTVFGDPWRGSATLTAASGFTNAGVINLTEYDNRGMGSTLILTTGVLTNTGTINVSNSATRTIRADLDNQGTLNVNSGLTLDKAGAVYSNTGAINIVSGKTLTVDGAPTFNQNGGVLSAAGGYVQNTGGSFNFNSGEVTGSGSFSLSAGTFNLAGAGAVSPVLTLSSCSLNIAPGATARASFVLYGNTTLTGNVATGQTVTVFGDPWRGSATLTATSGFTTAGVINLTEYDLRGMGSTMIVANGVLTNTGTINVNNSANRWIRASLDNQGAVNVNSGLTLDKAGAVYTNTGAINVPTGVTLTVNGGSFANTPPGTVAGSGTLVLTNVSFSGAGTITANVNVSGGSVSPGASPGILTIDGNYSQSGTTTLHLEVGGPDPGTGYDRINVTGAASLAGTLNVSLSSGFVPHLTQQFLVLWYGSKVGDFSAVNGLDLGGGMHFRRLVWSGEQTLVAYSDASKVNMYPTSLDATEGGAGVTYQIVLSSQPTAMVGVHFAPDGQVNTSSAGFTFSSDDWATVRTVTVTAVDDAVAEGAHIGVIQHTSTSTDGAFFNLVLPSVTVNITDNDAGVNDLALTKSASPGPVRVGQELTYTLTVTSSESAAGVEVVDNLPAGVAFVSASASQGTWTDNGSVVTFNVGDIAAGGSATLTVVVRPTEAGSITNSATVTSPAADVNPVNDTATAVTAVRLRGDVNLDGTVDIADLMIVAASYNTVPPSNPAADVNDDGSVDILDLVLVGLEFGMNSPA